MSKTIKVSIIIPVYNSEKYLSETLKSVRKQTFTEWECVIINDGSVDNSEKVILENIKDDSRFNYIYQENTGVCIARNEAVNQSVGEYILCLDADDLISANFLEETLKVLMSDDNIKIATSSVEYFGRSKGKLEMVSYDLGTLLAANQLVVTSLFRREDFDRVGGFNQNMKEGLEDWDFWIAVLKEGGRVERAENAVFSYRLTSNSRNTNVIGEKSSRLRYQIWLNHKELFSQYFVNPTSSFEYLSLIQSAEYKIGCLALKPLRYLLRKMNELFL